MADQRQKIISSVFSRRNATGNLEETYVSHVKIWEDAGPEGGGRKPRYILLSRMYCFMFQWSTANPFQRLIMAADSCTSLN